MNPGIIVGLLITLLVWGIFIRFVYMTYKMELTKRSRQSG